MFVYSLPKVFDLEVLYLDSVLMSVPCFEATKKTCRPPRGLGGAARTAFDHRRRRGARRGGVDWGGDISKDYTMPTDYTNPQKSIQSPDRLYKATKTFHVDIEY